MGAVWSTDFSANWIEAITVSLDYYNLEIDDAVQGRIPFDVVTACVNTLDPLFCDLTPRTPSGSLDVVNNQLQNIGAIEASGYDFLLQYTGPETAWGQFNASVVATFLDEYTETTANVDGSVSVTDRTGTHTNETFQRAFPELRTVTTVDWIKDRWNANLAFRWTDEVTAADATKVDSVMFTDLRVTYTPDIADDALTFSIGFNNLFDEDPPILATSTIGMSNVLHDLPGRIGYFPGDLPALRRDPKPLARNATSPVDVSVATKKTRSFPAAGFFCAAITIRYLHRAP